MKCLDGPNDISSLQHEKDDQVLNFRCIYGLH